MQYQFSYLLSLKDSPTFNYPFYLIKKTCRLSNVFAPKSRVPGTLFYQSPKPDIVHPNYQSILVAI
jgi:hypothetical protein